MNLRYVRDAGMPYAAVPSALSRCPAGNWVEEKIKQ